ncbi:hypothetical protein Ahy_B03g065439 [Arachis hypogaea]|uniref:Protein FAR1-RELATED SEQUENCE n=1 Tax=Arachis hypogaea TaxID=3818 RepID=A0A445A1S2_ARAHY|nr:hypothetical protein Ahy_B03g065439 [Arachis hypogaea]
MSHVIWNSFTKNTFDRDLNNFVTKSLFMDSSLSGSPLLGRDEKHRKEFSHRDTVPNKISNRGSILACVYSREVQGSSSTIQKKGELHHKTNAFYSRFYDIRSCRAECQCLLFKSRGILCHHSLNVLSFERIDKVTPKYILEHWSKNIKRRHTYIKSSQDEPLLEPRSKRFDDLVFRSHSICEFVSKSEELTGILYRAFDNVMVEMQDYQTKSKDAMLSEANDLQSPHVLEQEAIPRTGWDQICKKKDRKCNKEKEKASSKQDDGSMIQSSSSLYDAQDMNYPGEDYRSFSFY